MSLIELLLIIERINPRLFGSIVYERATTIAALCETAGFYDKALDYYSIRNVL